MGCMPFALAAPAPRGLQVSVSNTCDVTVGEYHPPPVSAWLSPTLLELQVAGEGVIHRVTLSRSPVGALTPPDLSLALDGPWPDASSVHLEVEDDVDVADLVTVVDALVGHGLPSVSVSPASGRR